MMAKLARIIRVAVWTAALLFLTQMILGFTGPPRALTDWLICAKLQPQETPHAVVVMGGGGIPSTTTLVRLYYAAEYGRNLTGTVFVVTLPVKGLPPEKASVGRMRDELVMRGIPAERILMETRGLGTRDEAVKTRELLGEEALHKPLVVVSSDFHLRRVVLAFRRAGFTNVRGLYADDIGAEAEFRFARLRYGFWGRLKDQVTIFRELIALAVYKACGWI